jgi:glycosyltransferase involved in cell wall biosynthesis
MTDTQPAVSVIVPCYRVTEYVPEALDSLRAQTFRNFETIVINDGCPDTANLERALEPYRSEIVYIKQENAGLAGARNRGITAARSSLVALLDADDVWEPDYLAVQTGILRARPEIDVLSPNAVYFGAGAGSWSGRKFMDMFPRVDEPTFQDILSGRCFVFVGVAARREALMRVGLFDSELRAAEDLDLWLRLAKAGAKLNCHSQPLVRYRIREGSLSDDRIALARAAIRVYRKLLDANHVVEEESREIQNAIRIQDAMIDLRLGRKALYAGNRDEALRRLARANEALNNHKLRAAIFMLRVWPGLLYSYIHRRYPTERSFLY